MRNAACSLYAHLAARYVLPLKEKFLVAKGTYLTLLNNDNDEFIFGISTSGKHLQEMVDDIKADGKFDLIFLKQEKDFYLFTLVDQEFVPHCWNY